MHLARVRWRPPTAASSPPGHSSPHVTACITQRNGLFPSKFSKKSASVTLFPSRRGRCRRSRLVVHLSCLGDLGAQAVDTARPGPRHGGLGARAAGTARPRKRHSNNGTALASLGTPLSLLSTRAADGLSRALSDVASVHQVQCSGTSGLPPAAGAPNGRPSLFRLRAHQPRRVAPCTSYRDAAFSWRPFSGWLSLRSGPPLASLRGRHLHSPPTVLSDPDYFSPRDYGGPIHRRRCTRIQPGALHFRVKILEIPLIPIAGGGRAPPAK